MSTVVGSHHGDSFGGIEPTEGSAGDVTEFRIAALDIRVVERAYRAPFQISGGDTETLTSVLVGVHAAGGVGAVGDTGRRVDELPIGVGETTPMTAYSGETAAGLVDAVRAVLAPAVVGTGLFDLAGLHRRMDDAMRGRALAKAALDIAVVDAQARVLGVPVWALLGGCVRRQVEIAWVIGLGDVDQIAAEARRQAERGFHHIKVKGGLDPDRDVRLVERLTAALPPGTELALDANGGYDVHTGLPALRAMERLGLALVEQPVPGWDVTGLAALTAALDMPVMADESLQSVHDAFRLIEERACDIVNIKLLKVGGLYRARQVAAIAEAAGVPVKVGSMPELGVATLAGLHFAAATPVAQVAADLVGPLMVRSDILTDPDLAADGASGRLTVPRTPGLGGDARLLFDPRRSPAPTAAGQDGTSVLEAPVGADVP